MDFSFTDEQIMLQDSVQKFVRDNYSFESRRSIIEGPSHFSKAHWQTFADLGWLTIPFSEADGGLGGSAIDLMLMMEEFGKGLVLEPYVATAILSGHIVNQLASGHQKQAILTQIMDGRLQLASALYEPHSRYNLSNVETSVLQADRGNLILNGTKTNVLNGHGAGLLLVSARHQNDGTGSDNLAIFLVEPTSPGVTIKGYRQVDGHSAATIEFTDVILGEDSRLKSEISAVKAINDAVDMATVAISAEAIGVLDQLLSRTVDYAKTRRQFGVPIGEFQALRHRMADMFIECQLARSIVLMAAMKMHGTVSDAEKSSAVSAAKCRIAKSIRLVSQEAIQIHGGIGMTDELDVAHYFKRATAISVQFGDEVFHARRFQRM